MDNIPQVANNATYINNAEFVKLTIYNDVANIADTNVYTFSSAYKPETINGVIYNPLGGLLGVGMQQRDIRATSADTSLTLSGIDGNNIAIVLESNGKIRGSKLEILRGFYNDTYVLTNTYPRFSGIVSSYSITEDRHDLIDTFTITLNASSFRSVLENRISGRKTNQQSWQVFNPTDTSMNNIFSISGQRFDFGMAVQTTTPQLSSKNLNDQTTNLSNQNGVRGS